MRVTQLMHYRSLLAGAEKLQEEIESASRQVATGKRISRLSDSPRGSAELVELRTELDRIDQYRGSTESSGFFAGLAESALTSAHSVITAIYTRGSQGASDVYDDAVRAELAAEVRALRDQLLSMANASAGGRYLFAGSRVSAAPFTLAGDAVTYGGDLVQNEIDVGEGLTVKQNVAGSEAFGGAFSAVEALVTALDSGDPAALEAALGQFEGALAGLSRARAELGVTLGILADAVAEQDSREQALRERRGAVEDANLAEAITRLQTNETALDAAFTAGAATGKSNLFDYLA